jgi:hypothetical protein
MGYNSIVSGIGRMDRPTIKLSHLHLQSQRWSNLSGKCSRDFLLSTSKKLEQFVGEVSQHTRQRCSNAAPRHVFFAASLDSSRGFICANYSLAQASRRKRLKRLQQRVQQHQACWIFREKSMWGTPWWIHDVLSTSTSAQ